MARRRRDSDRRRRNPALAEAVEALQHPVRLNPSIPISESGCLTPGALRGSAASGTGVHQEWRGAPHLMYPFLCRLAEGSASAGPRICCIELGRSLPRASGRGHTVVVWNAPSVAQARGGCTGGTCAIRPESVQYSCSFYSKARALRVQSGVGSRRHELRGTGSNLAKGADRRAIDLHDPSIFYKGSLVWQRMGRGRTLNRRRVGEGVVELR